MSGSTSTNNNTNININTITSSNNNNNSNGNREVSEDYTLFKFYMEKCYELPSELKNDIIYCQRAMRDFLKVHGLVSDVFKEQADADPVQMQRILDELEAEVYEINAEQNYLMLRLDEDLDIFYKKLEDSNIQTVPELGNEYISSLIVPLIGDASYKIYPQSVLMRDNEEMLIRKHFLISQDDEAGVEPLKLSELDDNVPLMLVNPSTATATLLDAQTTATTTAATAGNELKLMQPENLFNMGDNSVGGLTTLLSTPSQAQSALPLPPLLTQSKPSEHQQRSLLIPRGGSIAVEELPGGAVLSTQPPPLAMAKQVAGVVATVAAEISKPQTLKRSSTSPPPLAPITKVAATMATDFEVVAQSRMNLRQALRRARKTKQQPRLFDDEDALELPGSEKTAAQSTTALAPSSSSQVVSKQNKASLSKALAMELTTTAAAVSVAVAGVPSASSLAAKKSAQPAASKQYKTRNAYGAGRKPATPPPPSTVAGQHQAGSGAGAAASTARASSGSSGSSDDLHHELELEQQRLCASAAQWRDEPRETRVMPAEYGQEHFLGLFGLYTHDMVKKLCQRHSKRKRRTVQNASGVDFHYGQQLAAIDAVRQKKLKDKPEFLLSPKEKRLQAKKAHRAAAAAAASASAVAATTGTTATRKSKSKTPEKLEDLFGSSQSVEGGKQKCKECRKRADNLMTCQNCQGYYHLDCHEDAKGKTVSPQSHSQLSIRCPQCVRDWTNTARAKCFS